MSETNNPYAPPVMDDEPPSARDDEPVLASQGKRFVNVFVDIIAIDLVAYGVGYGVATMPGFNPNLSSLLGVSVWIGYYVFCEAVFQATLGKLITGTRVVAVGGGKPRLGQIIGRTFARMVPFEALSFLSRPPVGWHDRWSGTRVVRRAR